MAKSSTKVTEGKVSDLVFDDKNFNKGTEYGKALIDKSVERFGAGRSVVVDKNMRLMAGNKFTEAFGEHGGEDIVIVETTGDKLVVVKRTDMDLDTKEGRDYALADNATAKADLAWDNDVIGEVQQELGIEPEDWGVQIGDDEQEQKEKGQKDLSDKIQTEFKIEVDCVNEAGLEELYNELTERGYACRILTL